MTIEDIKNKADYIIKKAVNLFGQSDYQGALSLYNSCYDLLYPKLREDRILYQVFSILMYRRADVIKALGGNIKAESDRDLSAVILTSHPILH